MNLTVHPYTLSPFVSVKNSNNQPQINYQSRSNKLNQDVFVKNIKEPAFTSKPEDEDNDIISNLASVGVIAAPFLLSIAACEYTAKHADPNVIFLPDGSPLMRVKDLKMETETIKADGNDGSFSVKDTGINIKPEDYDYSDPEHGVYKNYDGSVDIDLLKHKYIDIKNNIVIDPDRQVSLVSNGEKLTSVVIPEVEDSLNFEGSSMQGGFPIRIAPQRKEYIEENHIEPEKDPHPSHDSFGTVAYPDDNRTIAQKILDFVNPNPTIHSFRYNHNKDYDIFGREILKYKDVNGNIKQVALDEKLNEIAHKYHIKDNNLGEIAEFVNKVKAEETLVHLNPEYASKLSHIETFEQFKDRLTHDSTNSSNHDIGHTHDVEHPQGTHQHSDIDNEAESEIEASDNHDDGVLHELVDFLGGILDNPEG